VDLRAIVADRATFVTQHAVLTAVHPIAAMIAAITVTVIAVQYELPVAKLQPVDLVIGLQIILDYLLILNPL